MKTLSAGPGPPVSRELSRGPEKSPKGFDTTNILGCHPTRSNSESKAHEMSSIARSLKSILINTSKRELQKF